MKKLESKDLQLLYQDSVGRFYLVGEATKTDRKPIIFINDQLEHRLQAFETATNITKNSCFRYRGTYEYDDKVHTPYIWVYDYPIHDGHKGIYSTELFTTSLCEAIKNSQLDNVDIMGIGVGGIIGIQASSSTLVDRVVAIHPPILSSPLANNELFIWKYLNWKHRMTAVALNLIIDSEFAFQLENGTGFKSLEHEADLDKVKVVGSSIYGLSKLSGIEKELSELVYLFSGLPNDGIVCFEPERLMRRGFDVIVDKEPVSHLKLANNTDYTNDIYKELLLRKK